MKNGWKTKLLHKIYISRREHRMNYTKPMEICKIIQKLSKNYSINLHLYDKEEVARRLTKLLQLRKSLDELGDILPKHPVYHENGKLLGHLYDDENMGNVMLSTGIEVTAAIQHTEWYFRKIACDKLILRRTGR